MTSRGAVLLSLFVFAALPAPAAEREAPARQLSDYFPADTIVYVEVPSVPEFIKGTKATGLVQLWNDDSMKAIRIYFEGRGSEEPANILAALRDYADTIPGGLALGFARGDKSVDWLAVVQTGPDASPAEALLDKVYAEETRLGRPPKKVDVSGVEATASDVGDEYSAVFDGLLVLGSKAAFSGAVERRKAASTPNLTTSVNFTRASSFVSGRPAYKVVMDCAAVLEKLRTLTIPGAAIPVAGILDAAGAGEIDTVSLEGSFRLSGVLEHVYVSTKSADAAILDSAGRRALDESRLALVPRDALFFAANTGSPAAAYRSWKAAAGQSPSKDDPAAALAPIEETSGVSVERDLLPAVGASHLQYFVVPEGAFAPGLAVGAGIQEVSLWEVTDEKAASAMLDRLGEAARLNPRSVATLVGWRSANELSVEAATLGNLKIWYLAAPGSAFSGPAMAVYRGCIIYANNKDTVKAVVDNLMAPGASIQSSADYARVRGALAKAPSEIGYVNVDRAIDFVYDNLMSGIASALDRARANGTVGFASSDLPPAYVVKTYLDGIGMSFSVSGNLLDIELYSPTGLAPAVLPAVALPALARMSELAAPAARAPADTDPSRARLIEIGRKLQLATIERKGAFPEKMTDVVPAAMLQAPADASPDSPVDYVYVPGRTTAPGPKKILVYERKGITPDGRNVLFTDGSVQFVKEEDFAKMLEGDAK